MRRLVCIPALSELNYYNYLTSKIKCLDDKLLHNFKVDYRVISELGDDVFSGLWHPLSQHYEERVVESSINSRSDVEALALRRWQVEFCENLSGRQDFLPNLTCLVQLLAGDHVMLRSGDIYTVPDRTGQRVQFPAPADLPRQASLLFDLMQSTRCGRIPAILGACISLVVISNAHMFTDGNGRLSRCIFNLLLRYGGLSNEAYIPLYELARRSRGGFLIRVRQVELQGEWAPIVEFALEAIRICRQVGGTVATELKGP